MKSSHRHLGNAWGQRSKFSVRNAPEIGRREFFQPSGQFAGRSTLTSALPVSALVIARKRLEVTVAITAFTYRSHAPATLEDLVEPYLSTGMWISSDLDAVSMYADQLPGGKTGRTLENYH